MSDNTIELNRRRVLGALIVIGLATAAAGAGTFAYFSDTEESTGNVIEAGTLNLSDPADGAVSVTNTVPDTWANGTVTASYNGSVDAEIDLNVSLAESSEPSEPTVTNGAELTASEFAAYLEVATANVTVGTTTENLLTSVTDANGNSRTDLDDLATAAPFDAVTGTNATSGDGVSLELDLYFVASAGNDAQADGVNATVSLTAEQPQAD